MNANVKKGDQAIILKGKKYTLQPISGALYMRILQHREDLNDGEAYNVAQFTATVDLLCECYGNKFKPDELLEELPLEKIVMEFALLEFHLRKRMDKEGEKFKQNFTSGGESPKSKSGSKAKT